MADLLETLTVTKRGKRLNDNEGNPKVNDKGVPVYDRITTHTIQVKSLTSEESDESEDFALALSPTRDPSDHNKMRAAALCAIRKFDGETIMRPRETEDVRSLKLRFTKNEQDEFTIAYAQWIERLEATDDPKDSPPDQESNT